MNLIKTNFHSRRAFLRRAGQLAFTGAALPTAINLAAVADAAAFDAGNDYKALVCVFLYGGNDYANFVVPYDDASYNAYSAIRGGGAGQAAGGIALAKSDLVSTLLAPSSAPSSLIGATGLQYALHPSLVDLAGLFNSGSAAVMLNTGPLVKPITKAQYQGTDRTTYPLPPKLFSHNDQQSIWQSSSPEGSTIGWGGNVGDLALNSNSNALFTCISVTGNAVFLAGDQALSYQVGNDGAVNIWSQGDNAYTYGFQAVGAAMKSLISGTGRVHQLESEYSRVTKRAIDAEVAITAAVGARPANSIYAAPFDKFDSANPLAKQLRMVARMIKARGILGNKRQVFMVSMGGFDLHDNLLTGHVRQLGRVNSALKAFYDCMRDLGLADKVTAFTASDFGRTLSSNGDGSDHGWGGHHLIVGDAVNGKNLYGYAPPVSVGTSSAPADQWHVGQGRLLPTTSVDQYAATLAKWFGVDTAADMNNILPNLNNFGGNVNGVNYATDMGFMKAA